MGCGSCGGNKPIATGVEPGQEPTPGKRPIGAPQPATLVEQAKSVGKAAKSFLGSGGKITPKAQRDERMNACVACEYLDGPRCALCKCFVGLKVQLPEQECPVEKWGPVK